MEQREGRIIRQGNRNNKVHIYRYVTEGTFDSYMWQLIENKQRFISQIMTSKSPVRSCEDVDDTALSYAEVKAMAAGNPAIKEKMALDVEVSKLKLLKSNFVSNQYRLEDDITQNFPQQIAKLEEQIKAYQADIQCYQENKISDLEKFQMEITGKVFSEKKEAGYALLAICKSIDSYDSQLDVGKYQGFSMRVKFDSWSKEYVLTLKNESVSAIHLGSDELGNITRINNALEALPQKLGETQQKLETVQEQLSHAKEEVQKLFPKEEELKQKLERLSELNALLNMDAKKPAATLNTEEELNNQEEDRTSLHEKISTFKQNKEECSQDNVVQGRQTEVCMV